MNDTKLENIVQNFIAIMPLFKKNYLQKMIVIFHLIN